MEAVRQAIMAAMAEPDSMAAMFKGVGAMPEILAQMAHTGLGGFLRRRLGGQGAHEPGAPWPR